VADCIEEQVTQNLKNRLETLSTYPVGETVTVERERMILRIGARYPYIMLIGPTVETDDKVTTATHDTLTYIIKYYVNKNDENSTEDSELPYLTRNVCSDITKHIMNDVSRGGLAQNTSKISNGYGYDLSEDGLWEYYRYVIVEVKILIDKLDPYVIG